MVTGKISAEDIGVGAKQKDEEAKATKDKRENRRHDYFVAAFSSGLGFILGVFSTLLFQHYAKIVTFIKNIFH